MFILNLVFLFVICHNILADTPANCTYEDAHGTWKFNIYDYSPNCSIYSSTNKSRVFKLLYPNIAVDEYGMTGTWTLIYNQGFEINLNYRKWLVMFDYNKEESLCNLGRPSWTHDTFVRQWFCFKAEKLDHKTNLSVRPLFVPSVTFLSNARYSINDNIVKSINEAQNLWTAKVYDEFKHKSLLDMIYMKGGFKFKLPSLPFERRLKSSVEFSSMIKELPESFDWRNLSNGMPSPVTPVRNQHTCGSCYAFASTGAMESRIRLVTNFTQTPILSPQDIVDCSQYSEGCAGGFPYLIAGKYSEDFGMVEEKCNPYKGFESGSCHTKKNCKRYYATNYKYIGGYYGASNEDLMKLELVTNGPFPIGFEVYDDFMYYSSGIYIHTGYRDVAMSRFNPFELTNHAVLLVGYGVDQAKQIPYWIIKNSWGTEWGEDGFFRILRGSDECAVESLGVSFDPVI